MSYSFVFQAFAIFSIQIDFVDKYTFGIIAIEGFVALNLLNEVYSLIEVVEIDLIDANEAICLGEVEFCTEPACP